MSIFYKAGGDFDKAIEELVRLRGGAENSFLFQEMMITALKLIDEQAERGDLKVINTALKELRYAFKVFSPYRHIYKVSVFGSARSSRTSTEYKMASLFAKTIVKKNWMVITGAASGVMEAANAGAGKGNSFGINIRLPHEQEANPFIREDKKLINLKYFFTRKLIFIRESHAIALFPGGFGTHDEGFESLTLVQTGKAQPLPIVMVDDPKRPYWKEWLRFVRKCLRDSHYISEEDMDLFKITTDINEAVEEITRFYSNYHSSRYVGDLFVIRVLRVSSKMVDGLNEKFQDVLNTKGRFEAVKPFPEEAYEGKDMDLPRIAFPFNRKSYGRIRQIIDYLNRF